MISNLILKVNLLIILISTLFISLNFSTAHAQIPNDFWLKRFSNVGYYENLFSIDYCNDGGYILGGFTTYYDAGDILLIKTDSDGNVKWQKILNFNDSEILIKVFTDSDGKIIVFSERSTNNNSLYFTVLDSIGNLISDSSLPISQILYIKGINSTQDGGFIVCGTSNLNNTNATNIFFIKLSHTGDVELFRYYYDFDIYNNYLIEDIIQTVDSGYIACGQKGYLMGGGGRNFIIKFNSAGDTIWTKQYNLSLSNPDFASSILESDDGLIIAGAYNYYSGSFVIKIDSNGNLIWSKIYDLINGGFQSITKDTTSGYILANHTYINGKNSLNLLQINSLGDSLEARFITDSLNIFPPFIIKNIGNNEYLVGCTIVDSLEFDFGLIKLFERINIQISPSCDTTIVVAFQQIPSFLIKLENSISGVDSLIIYPMGNTSFIYTDSLGNLLSTDKFLFLVTDSLDEFNYEIWFEPINPPGNSYQLSFDSTYLCDLSLFNLILRVKRDDKYIAQKSQPFKTFYTLLTENNSLINTFSLEQNYPNPFNSQTKITWYSPTSCRQILKLYDILGNEVAVLVDDTKTSGKHEVTLNAEELKLVSGVYFFRLLTEKYSSVKKLIYMK